MRNLGGAVGIAMLATLIDTRSRHYLWQLKENLTAGSLNLTEYLTTAGNMLTAQGGNKDQAYGVLMKEMANQASVMAFNEGFLLMAILLFIAAIAVISIKPAK